MSKFTKVQQLIKAQNKAEAKAYKGLEKRAEQIRKANLKKPN